MKRLIALTLTIILMMSLVACGNDINPLDSLNPEQVTVDFENEKDFEAALNADFDVIGKVVTFTVDKIAPDSAFGFNLQTGEHLNFCSEEPQDVEEGDTLTVRVTEVDTFLISYIISYERIKDSDIVTKPAEENKPIVSDTGVASISLNGQDDIVLSVGEVHVNFFKISGSFDYSPEDDTFNISTNDFIFVSSNPNVVAIESLFPDEKLSRYNVYYSLSTKQAGASTIHFETKDGVVVSDKFTVTVTEEVEDTDIYYSIVDKSTDELERTTIKAMITSYSEEKALPHDLTVLLKTIVQNEKKESNPLGIRVLLYATGDDTDGPYTISMCDYAPLGDWDLVSSKGNKEYLSYDYKILIRTRGEREEIRNG